MSREHLYKSKRVNWKELPKEEWWVEGYLTQRKDSHGKVFESWIVLDAYEQLGVLNMKSALVSEIDFNCYKVDPQTVCEYTWKTDKKGTKIWENDICKVGEFIFKVVFKNSHWDFEIISGRTYCNPWFDSHCGDYCEVIGNIFDNLELLEGDKVE